MDEERSSGPDMNGECEVVDAEPDVSENRSGVNWTFPDMESIGGAAWRGTMVKDHELSKVHAVDGGHAISLKIRNDGTEANVAGLALMAASDREKNGDSDDVVAAVGGWSKAVPDGT
jgi:hypothetical protein